MKDDYKVLLVDDDEDILWLNQMILSDAGFSVESYNDPEEALKRIKSEKFRAHTWKCYTYIFKKRYMDIYG